MEFLKSNPEIDELYHPNSAKNHVDYFSRALKFAQTNYHEHLVKITRINFKNMTSTMFFREYVLNVLCSPNNLVTYEESKMVNSHLRDYYHSFWEVNNFPSKERMQQIVEILSLTEDQFQIIHKTAYIVNQGIKLFGWDKYRDNFLNSSGKLSVLPSLGLSRAKLLAQSVGLSYDPDCHQNLYDLAVHFKFQNATEMCQALQKNFPMSTRTIGTILWYSTKTFGTPDIVNAD